MSVGVWSHKEEGAEDAHWCQTPTGNSLTQVILVCSHFLKFVAHDHPSCLIRSTLVYLFEANAVNDCLLDLHNVFTHLCHGILKLCLASLYSLITTSYVSGTLYLV
jgi:hypothetical protein